MADKLKDEILNDHNHDGIDRRGFLKCMAWAGTGAFCVMKGGVLKSYSLSRLSEIGDHEAQGELSFVQISDSHMGFSKPANTDVVATMKAAIDKINALPTAPGFILHTGDISHLSKPEEFDTVDQLLKSANAKDVFFVPGEHDVLNDDGKQYLDRYGKGAKGAGWHSFDKKGVHFIGLVNVMNLKAGGLGTLGNEQLEWMEKDVKHLSKSTPIVVFAHIPLWAVYPEWGWGTQDSAQALGYLKRFGSVTVLNGHIHQTMQKVEGNITFHTATSTAFPQPKPGAAPSPGPMKVPLLQGATKMKRTSWTLGIAALVIGFAMVRSSPKTHAATPETKPATGVAVKIDNFTFAPGSVNVPVGTTVRWTNHDDIPHTVVSDDKTFKSKVLDTDEEFTYTFTKPGTYSYFCSIHPKMTAKVVVQ